MLPDAVRSQITASYKEHNPNPPIALEDVKGGLSAIARMSGGG